MQPNEAITAAFNMLPVKMAGQKARVILLAIQLQEDPQQLRAQMNNGPARGLWQFEKGGGCKGVLNHPATKREAERVCELRHVTPTPEDVWATIRTDDVLAACFARLLMFSDPQPLPEIGEVRQAFDLYLRTWRPGAYTRGTEAQKMSLYTKWQLNYAKAMDKLNA